MNVTRKWTFLAIVSSAAFALLFQGCDDSGEKEDTQENTTDACGDELDNDEDGSTDCEDVECYAICEAAETYDGITQAYNGGRGQSFNSGWKFILDDEDNADDPDFDDSDWREVDLPHDWSIELSFNRGSAGGSNNGYLDGGVGWYRKTFEVPAYSSSKQFLIQFDGVYMNGEVWINGKYLGIRPYGYSSFEYDITKYIDFGGTNVIAVRVDNNQPNSRWYSGSGIYRNVWLTKLHAVHIPTSGVTVTTPSVDDDTAEVEVTIEAESAASGTRSVTAVTTITDPEGEVVVTEESEPFEIDADGTETIDQTLTVDSPILWSIAAPNLYKVTVTLSVDGETVDTYVAPLGFRNPAFDPDTGFSLNGEKMKLQGVNMHHDLGALGTAINVRAMERQVEILKAMGTNAIRMSHNPPAPEYLDVCDRMGILVIDEAFDTWRQEKTDNDYALYFDDWAERDIKDMVKRDRNHPSIFAWSIGNEIYAATTAIAEDLIAWVKEMDDTRPVTWASNQMESDPAHEDISDLLDMQGYNYAGYSADYDAAHEENPDWIIFGSETGAAVRSRGIYHTPVDEVIKANEGSSSDQQCSSYDNEAARFGESAEVAYEIDNSRPFVQGSFIWAGFDYIGEPTPYSFYPSKSSYYGIIDTAGFPKDIYYFYQSRWTKEPMVHILPHWNWSDGDTIPIFVYSNCDSVELFLNDGSKGSQTFEDGALRLEWALDFEPGSLRAECTVDGDVVAETEVTTADDPAAVALTANRESIAADGLDLIFITADILDADNVFVPTADNEIEFSISGPGKIVGTDSGNPIDTTPYQETVRPAFSGKVLAIVQSTGEAGEIIITADADGLDGDSVTVAAE